MTEAGLLLGGIVAVPYALLVLSLVLMDRKRGDDHFVVDMRLAQVAGDQDRARLPAVPASSAAWQGPLGDTARREQALVAAMRRHDEAVVVETGDDVLLDDLVAPPAHRFVRRSPAASAEQHSPVLR